VAVARGLVGDPVLLLADEPTANLDHISAESVIGLLRELRSAGRTILISTHDTRLLPAVDRVVEMTGVLPNMVASTEPVQLADGETLFVQGDASDFVFSIEHGTVEIVREFADGGEEVLATASAPGYVGELGPLLGFPRSATVRASGPVTLRPFTAVQFRARATTAAIGTRR
jgi:putative ABC transport system ATP-binding protein